MSYPVPAEFDNQPLVDPATGKASSTFQLWFTAFLSVVNVTKQKVGTTAAIVTGATVNHGLGKIPTSVLLTARDTGLSDIYADTFTSTTFKVHFAGGGSHAFSWLVQ